MLTLDFDRWQAGMGEWLLDIGCGAGRHTFEALRRGYNVVSIDLDAAGLVQVASMSGAMRLEGEISAGIAKCCVRGDALRLPFRPAVFDRVIVSEVLEHIESDETAMAEVARVLKPGGGAAVTVPRYWPERVCWALSDAYHSKDGGHVRIYRSDELAHKLERAGLFLEASHHAHALHSPYWWLKCLVGVERDALPARAYHRFLVWDLTSKPRLTGALESALNPLMGKSLVLYLEKPATEMAST